MGDSDTGRLGARFVERAIKRQRLEDSCVGSRGGFVDFDGVPTATPSSSVVARSASAFSCAERGSMLGNMRFKFIALVTHIGSIQSSPWKFIDWFISSGTWWQVSGVVWACSLVVLFALLLDPEPAWLGRFELTHDAVERGIAASNCVAFLSYHVQVPGLIGMRGLSPASDLMRRRRAAAYRQGATWSALAAAFCRTPTVCWFIGASDRALKLICQVGIAISTSLMVLAWNMPPAVKVLAWWSAGLLYLSLINVSGDFLGLQSDANTPEVDFVLGLVAPFGHSAHAVVGVLVLRFFAFRKMLACGICKYYGSASWKQMTAMRCHYFTQPLPNAVSFYAHHLPAWAHGFSVLITFVVEVLCPFFLWVPSVVAPRYVAWVAFNALNFGINLTGNYGFIGFLNTAENLACTDDRIWHSIMGWSEQTTLALRGSPPLLMRLALWPVFAAYMSLSLLPLAQSGKGSARVDDLFVLRFLPNQIAFKMQSALSELQKMQRPFRLCNYQGKFASMQDYRWEPRIEGSLDGREWRQFHFRYKPTSATGRPVILPLHLPRLDWRIWFLPHRARRGEQPPEWFHELLVALLEGRSEVLSLLAEPPPFLSTQHPLPYVWCRLDNYTFADFHGKDGGWWSVSPLSRQTTMHVTRRREAP